MKAKPATRDNQSAVLNFSVSRLSLSVTVNHAVRYMYPTRKRIQPSL